MLQTPQRFPRAGSQSYPTPAATANADGSTTVTSARSGADCRRELDPDDRRQGLFPVPAPLQPARAVLRQELASERDRPRVEREEITMSDRPVFLYAAVYDSIDDAEADYEAVFDLHAARRDRDVRLRRDPQGGGRQGPRHEDGEAHPARGLDRCRRRRPRRHHLPAVAHRHRDRRRRRGRPDRAPAQGHLARRPQGVRRRPRERDAPRSS